MYSSYDIQRALSSMEYDDHVRIQNMYCMSICNTIAWIEIQWNEVSEIANCIPYHGTFIFCFCRSIYSASHEQHTYLRNSMHFLKGSSSRNSVCDIVIYMYRLNKFQMLSFMCLTMDTVRKCYTPSGVRRRNFLSKSSISMYWLI